MSYLDAPRISFRGSCNADAPTNNNLLECQGTVGDVGVPLPNWTWNPNGRGIFRLYRKRELEANSTLTADDICRVVGAWDESGKFLQSAQEDPILGGLVFDIKDSSSRSERLYGSAKITDLDPQQRRLTQMIGLPLSIALPTSDPSQTISMVYGRCETTHMRDFWMRGYSDLAQPTNPVTNNGTFSASAAFQTTLIVEGWGDRVAMSPLMAKLKAISPDRLSVRLITTAFQSYTIPGTNDVAGQASLLGTIGPYRDGEPREFVAGRRLIPSVATPYPFNYLSGTVDEAKKRLTFDLGNAVPWQIASWTRPPADWVDAVTLKTVDGADEIDEVIGQPVRISTPDWLKTCGIGSWDLTDAQVQSVGSKRLGLAIWQGDVRRIVAAEHPSGKYADLDTRSFRLNPGESAKASVRAFHLGKPLAGQTLAFDLHQQRLRDVDATLQIFPPDQDELINSRPADVILNQPLSVTTDATGRAELDVAIRPGPIAMPAPRAYVDSQLYFLGDPAGWQSWGCFGSPMGANCALNVLVFNTHDPVVNPSWKDVGPILQKYARLYPGMKSKMDIGDEATVTQFAALLLDLMSRGLDDPASMPVTRDLSAANRAMILSYLKARIPGGATDAK